MNKNIRSGIVHEKARMRKMIIVGFGRVLIRAWVLIQTSLELEALVITESISEAQIMKEKFVDLACDIFRACADGVKGKALVDEQTLPDDFITANAYYQVIADVFGHYNRGFDEFTLWTDSLLGLQGNGTNFLGKTSLMNSRNESLSLLPLITIILTMLLEDSYTLLSRWNHFPSFDRYYLKYQYVFVQTYHLLKSILYQYIFSVL